MERMQQLIGATLVAYLIYPLFVPLAPRNLDDVKAWGLKGPGKDLPIPFMGVYAFKGLNPAVTLDLSYAYDYDAKAKTFWLDFTPDSVTVAADASGSAFESDQKYASTSMSPTRLPGWYVLKQFALLRYRVQFTLESPKLATIRSCIAGCWSPLSHAYNAAVGETLELRGAGVLARVNYASLSNRTRISEYELLPLLMPGGKVDKRGLSYAKGKLALVSATLKGSLTHGAS